MKERKPRIKKIREKRSFKDIASGMLFAVIGLVLAGGLFIGLMFLQSYFSDDITYKEVVVAAKDIPAGEVITEKNVAEYFTSRSYNALNLPNDALTMDSVSVLVGQKSLVDLKVGETVAFKDFKNISEFIEGIENPIEVSLALSTPAASDGGKIREGDLVNITLMFAQDVLPKEGALNPTIKSIVTEASAADDKGDKADVYYVDSKGNHSQTPIQGAQTLSLSVYNYASYAQYILQNVYVSKALTNDGTVIAPTDSESTAQILVFVIPKTMELELNNALENCSSMRVSKVLYEISVDEYFKQAKETPTVTEEVVLYTQEEEPAKEEEPAPVITEEVEDEASETENTDEELSEEKAPEGADAETEAPAETDAVNDTQTEEEEAAPAATE